MNTAISLGPFAIGLDTLAVAAVFAAASFVGWLAARSRRLPVGGTLTAMFWGALLVARVFFVARWFGPYAESPWSILDIRDGGFDPWGAACGAVAVAAWQWVKAPALRVPIASTVATGAVMAGLLLALPSPEQAPGGTLSTAALETLEGAPITVAALGEGHPTVVNLWATWCPPCRREMPVLAQAQARERDVRFVLVDQGEEAALVRRYLVGELAKMENVLLDPGGKLSREVGSSGLPTTLFYDASGRLVDTHVGALSAATLAAKLTRARRAAAPRR